MINPKLIIALLVEKFGCLEDRREPSRDEKAVLDVIDGLLQSGCDAGLLIEYEYDLSVEKDEFEGTDDCEADKEQRAADAGKSKKPNLPGKACSRKSSLKDDEPTSSSSTMSVQSAHEPSSGEVFEPSSTDSYGGNLTREKGRKRSVDFAYKERAVSYSRKKSGRPRKFSAVKLMYYKCTSAQMLRRWKKEVEDGGSREVKLDFIHQRTFAEFMKHPYAILHDIDIKRFALQVNRDVKLENFKASGTFIRSFKKRYRIGYKKIVKFVTSGYQQEEKDIKQRAVNFLREAKPEIQQHDLNFVFNYDQSGINLELHTKGKLAIRGCPAVAEVQKVASTTHSYTVMPIITASGKLAPVLYMVLPDTKGFFGPQQREELPPLRNVYVDCSKSGKMSTVHMKRFFKHVMFPTATEASLFIHDSWPAFGNLAAIQEEAPEGASFSYMTIPPRCTGIVQPLDVFFFRYWKMVVKKVNDYLLLEDIDIDIGHRTNIVLLNSLIHRQFSAPRFEKFIKRAWKAFGIHESEHVITPVEYCFDPDVLIKKELCEKIGCDEPCFVRCAWCSDVLCMTHFFVDYHSCDD